MKRLLLLFAAILMASTGMWATDNVAYIDATGVLQHKDGVTEITNSTTTLSGWCVVNSTVTTGTLTCSGEVHLILADGAKLTATGGTSDAGIQISGTGNSLTIYGQAAQSGQLIATGGDAGGAGIGGKRTEYGSNITINGGIITATSAGLAAGIGGGYNGNGSNITINGGTVTATGGTFYTTTVDGIGSGKDGGTASNIFVATKCIVKAGSAENPTDVIENTGGDLAGSFAGKQYVTVETPKFAVTYGDDITVSPAFPSGAEIAAGTQITFTAADRTANNYGFIGFYKESTFDTPITTGVNGSTYTVMVTDAPISVYARYGLLVSYVYPVYNDPDDVTEGVKEWETETVSAIEVTSSATPVTWGEVGKETWYVVTGEDVQLSQGAICYGHVNLIVADGAKLTANGIADYSEHYNYIYTPGIQVSGAGNSLAIYGQTAQSGQLEAIGRDVVAGIGGGKDCSGSNITINGGTVTAIGAGKGAGIGGGDYGDGYNITINGGTVTARSMSGACIGGGASGSGYNITINGGTVTAIGETTAAGIGGGYKGNGSNITINGGTVTANGGKRAAGIGGGYMGSGSNITINGGTVTATGGEYNGQYGEGIGIGFNGSASSGIYVRNNQLLVRIGDTEDTMYLIANNTGSDFAESLAGKRYVTIEPEPAPEEKEVTYIDENGEEQKVKANVVLSRSFPVTWGEAGKTTWYVVTHADVQLISPVCQGDIRLILTDGAKLTANGLDDKVGIQISGEGNFLTIYGQTAQTGQLEANGGERAAGIGGGDLGSGSNITINGGTVTATGTFGAGIGGGFEGSGSHITINGGIVTATSTYGAGIGGGNDANGSNITINGGIVTATNKGRGAGIGGGYIGSGSNITINGGTVTATGGIGGAGIGSGCSGAASSNITVSTILTLKAGDTENSADAIANNGGDLAESLAGQQYVTVSDAICNITANQDPNNKANYYSTFYSGTKAYSVPSGVTAYTGVAEGNVLKLTAIESGVIPAEEPVILKASQSQVYLPYTTTTATKSTDNMLEGTDEETTLSANQYALSLGQKGVGFYLWEGKAIGANKAYLTLNASGSAKAFIFQFDDDPTGIESLTPALSEGEGAIYNLNGIRVNNGYKGIVIKNGKKVYQK